MAYNINDYEPVEDRLSKFWNLYPEGRIATALVFQDETRFIVQAAVFRNHDDHDPAATGFAEERVDSNPKRVNFASALENCETSALGRALANFNFATKSKRPSREEMEKVSRAISTPLTPLDELRGELNKFSSRPDERKSVVTFSIGREIGSLAELTLEEIEKVRAEMKTRSTSEQAKEGK